MSFVGLLPPLSDNGNMLVDGGYSEHSLSLRPSVNHNTFQLIICPYGTHSVLLSRSEYPLGWRHACDGSQCYLRL
jgi:hypothetical protein